MEENDAKMEALVLSWEIVASDKLTPIEEQSYEELEKKLAIFLNDLLLSDFNKLISILYRIDVAQEKAMAALSENDEKETPGETLARLIINRQLKKIETRKKYRKN